MSRNDVATGIAISSGHGVAMTTTLRNRTGSPETHHAKAAIAKASSSNDGIALGIEQESGTSAATISDQSEETIAFIAGYCHHSFAISHNDFARSPAGGGPVGALLIRRIEKSAGM